MCGDKPEQVLPLRESHYSVVGSIHCSVTCVACDGLADHLEINTLLSFILIFFRTKFHFSTILFVKQGGIIF